MSRDNRHFGRTAKILLTLGRHLAREIIRLREERGWTLPILAHEARLQQKRIARMEVEGYTTYDLDDLARLAAAFDCDLEINFIKRKDKP